MRNLLKIITMVLPYLLDWSDDRVRERKRKKRQEKRDEAAKDPGSMFSSEFAGGRVLADKTGDAETASQANAGSDGKPSG